MISKMTNQELFQFFGQFSIILRSGMSTVEGLSVLNDDSQYIPGKRDPCLSLQRHGRIWLPCPRNGKLSCFPASAIAYVRTGEETGCLDEVVSGLATFLSTGNPDHRTDPKRCDYPLIMLGMMSAVIVILLVKVLPVFRQVFHQLGLEVTGFAGGLLGLGEAMSRYSIVLIVILLFLIAFIFFLCFHPKGRLMVYRIVYKMPGVKEIPFSLDYSRLCQCISMGIRSGFRRNFVWNYPKL